LGHKFKRKDLLKFCLKKNDSNTLSFDFKRLDNNRTVCVTYHPDKIPFAREKAARLGELLERVIWEAAKKDEKIEFQNLWMEKVRDMLVEEKEMNRWIKIGEKNE